MVQGVSGHARPDGRATTLRLGLNTVQTSPSPSPSHPHTVFTPTLTLTLTLNLPRDLTGVPRSSEPPAGAGVRGGDQTPMAQGRST